MSRILVLYGTTEGQTAKIASAVARTMRAQGDDVEVIAADAGAPDPAGFSGVLVAASVHAGRYQRPVERWVRTHASQLAGLPTAFVSVSLGVLQQEPKVQQEVAAIVGRFLVATGWTPAMVKSVAGALVYTKYNWLERRVMRRIAKEAGGDTDTSKDYEYTDWRQVEELARTFSRMVRERTVQAPAA
jgi:menaquinone-dependent protoporphyrinogen oxidase